MLFNLKTKIVMNAAFKVEAETLEEARKIAEKRMNDLDFDSLEMAEVWWDMTDPTIKEFIGKMCKKQLERYNKSCATEP
jgi:hypothetical protein